MAGKQTFHVEVENDLRGCAILLKSVVCEWLLIFFLLVDAVYLYFLKKFAKYCNLQLPCMLCSRLDHIFGNEKPDFYKDLICNEHRSKLSSLVFCHNHGRLADVHDVCEECLLSFATKKDSSPEIYKFLIGKLGLDGLRNPISEMDFFNGFVTLKSCSCCNKQWRCRPNVQKLVKSQSFGSRSFKPDNIPLPTTTRQSQKHLNRRDAVLKSRDRIVASAAPAFFGVPDSESRSQGGYSKLKKSSDSESDFVFPEVDDGTRELDHHVDQQGHGFSFKKQFEERFATKKVISPTNMASDDQRQQIQPELITPMKESQGYENGLEQNFNSSKGTAQPPTTPKSLFDKHDKANGEAETWEAFDLMSPDNRQGDDEDKKDGITITTFHSGFNQTKPSRFSEDQNVIREMSNLSSTTQLPSTDDKDDAPFRFKVNGHADDPFKDTKVSQKPTSLETSESMENIRDHNLIAELRKQIEEDQECIDRLRMELEEERSAAAEAANQAMAMITKLQEEKAVLNMDAQQYLRMMEEQAEHDLEALENTNDLLAEKEKEIQDMEAELEFYRMKYPDEYEEEITQAEFLSQGMGKSMGFQGFSTSNKEKLAAENHH